MNARRRLNQQLVEALRLHLRTGRKVSIPEAGRLAWAWFSELNGGRRNGMVGPEPIGLDEILAWSTLHRWPIEGRHVETIREMDRAWLAYFRQADPRQPQVRTSDHAITPAAFDAVFG